LIKARFVEITGALVGGQLQHRIEDGLQLLGSITHGPIACSHHSNAQKQEKKNNPERSIRRS
jgi:hypothetical protein